MSNENIEQPVEVVETPVETPVVETPNPEPEFVYEYQPVDEQGRKLGNKQVFKGKDANDVLAKVAKAHQESIKLNRELNKRNRLGIVDKDEIPEEVPRFSNDGDFTPRELTDEEKYEIARDLGDPERFDEASNRLFEAKFGARPQRITEVLQEQGDALAKLRARMEAEAFVSETPEYFPCKENTETITSWMLKNKLAPIRSNFKYAFDQLSGVGLLLEAPTVREEPPVVEPQPQVTPANSQPEVEPVSRITDPEPPQSKRTDRVASGFNRDTVQDVGGNPNQSKSTLTVEQIERMSSDEYARRLRTDRNFAKAVDEAYAVATQRR